MDFRCNHCGASLRANGNAIGRGIRCPRCKKAVVVPVRRGTQPQHRHPLSGLTKNSLRGVQAAIRDFAVQRASASLAIWGTINLCAYIFFAGNSREVLRRLNDPNIGICALLYGVVLLSLFMLACAVFGALTRHPATIALHGLCLMGVGLWHVTHDFVAMEALSPYGYKLEGGPTTFWILFGVSQIAWGRRSLSAFGDVLSWDVPNLRHGSMSRIKRRLVDFVKLSEDDKKGLVEASVTIKSVGLVNRDREKHYVGALLRDFAVMVSRQLDECFTIDRESTDYAVLGLSEKSLAAFQAWARPFGTQSASPSLGLDDLDLPDEYVISDEDLPGGASYENGGEEAV